MTGQKDEERTTSLQSARAEKKVLLTFDFLVDPISVKQNLLMAPGGEFAYVIRMQSVIIHSADCVIFDIRPNILSGISFWKEGLQIFGIADF